MENVFIIANKLAQKLSLKIDLGRDIGQKLYWDIGEEETVKTEIGEGIVSFMTDNGAAWWNQI